MKKKKNKNPTYFIAICNLIQKVSQCCTVYKFHVACQKFNATTATTTIHSCVACLGFGGLGSGHKLAKCRKPSKCWPEKLHVQFLLRSWPIHTPPLWVHSGCGSARAQSVPHSAIYYTFVQTEKMKNADKNNNNNEREREKKQNMLNAPCGKAVKNLCKLFKLS